MITVKEGTRIEVADYVDRFPFFQAEPGMTGTVTEADETILVVKMIDYMEGAEDWDNCLIFNLPEDQDELRCLRAF